MNEYSFIECNAVSHDNRTFWMCHKSVDFRSVMVDSQIGADVGVVSEFTHVNVLFLGSVGHCEATENADSIACRGHGLERLGQKMQRQ